MSIEKTYQNQRSEAGGTPASRPLDGADPGQSGAPNNGRQHVLDQQDSAISWLEEEIGVAELKSPKGFTARNIEALMKAKSARVSEETLETVFARAGFPGMKIRKINELIEECGGSRRKESGKGRKSERNRSETPAKSTEGTTSQE